METSSQSDTGSTSELSFAGGTCALTPLPPDHRFVARTERGLVVRGTRLTLYDIWERLAKGMDQAQVQGMFSMSNEQMEGVIDFIEQNRQAFEAEYQSVVARAEEARRYWETRNRRHGDATLPSKSDELPADPGTQLVSIVGKIWELTERIFPGPITIDYAFDPEDRSHEYIVFDVTAKGEFMDYRERFFEWHDEVEKIVPNRAGEFRLLVHPRS